VTRQQTANIADKRSIIKSRADAQMRPQTDKLGLFVESDLIGLGRHG
jgi:hypothetical protein